MSNVTPTKVNGLELTHASISCKVVSSSVLVRLLPPNDFLRADLIDLTNLSHHPPHHGALGKMNFHSGVR